MPLEVAEETWVWVPVPETRCGYGSPTGFAVNATSRSTKLLVYLMGGGGCYDSASCSAGRAANLHGYDQTTAGRELGFFQAGSIFDRADTTNPFHDWDWVFIPYCTGDFHSGTARSSYGVAHVGSENLAHDLRHIVPTFCDAERVAIAGSSAGGFGAVLGFDLVRDAFAPARMDLIDDSGPFLPPPYMSTEVQRRLRDAWSARVAPVACPTCADAWHAYYAHLAESAPEARLSLISSLGDYSIGGFFGLGPDQMRAGLTALHASTLGPLPRARVFYIAGSDHVWLGRRLSSVTSGGQSLAEFLRHQLDDDPRWSDALP